MSKFPQVLEFRRLHRSALPTWGGLVLGSWLGVVFGGLLTALSGLYMLLPGFVVGFLTVPLWGTFWGLVGASRARDKAAGSGGIQLLPEEHGVSQITYDLCDRLGMTARPWVGTMANANAYAIGSKPEKSLVVIGTPLIDNLEPLELAAIIGHELGHVANNDMRRMAFARSFQNALVWFLMFNSVKQFARWILTWGSELAVLGLSRRREYWADAVGAALTSKEAMIGALEKLHANAPPLSQYEVRNARIMFRGFAEGSMFSTHPTLAERVAAVRDETYLRRLPLLKGAGSSVPTRVAAAPSSTVAVSPSAADLAY